MAIHAPVKLLLPFISLLMSVGAGPAHAQVSPFSTPVPVTVVNTTKNPVPTLPQGTTSVSGSVNVTNNPLPISGSVQVSNFPLDATGNLRTSVAPDTTQYQYLTIVGELCNTNGNFPTDVCSNGTPVATLLDSYSSQGYQLMTISPALFGSGSGISSDVVIYTLRSPVTQRH